MKVENSTTDLLKSKFSKSRFLKINSSETKVFKSNQVLRGLVSDVTNTTASQTLAAGSGYADAITYTKGTSVFSGSFIPEFWRKGSIDDIIDHVCGSRFGTGNLTAFAFKNETAKIFTS